MPLGTYLDRLDQENALPKVIIYNLNPADNYAMATMIGNFQDGTTAGKVQLGSGWWFNDQKEAMEWQMNALSNCGLISRFVGMLTDSRSFMSYPRHEYFRRVLCDLFGKDIEAGELPDDRGLAGNMIRNICYSNAREFLGLAGGLTYAPDAAQQAPRRVRHHAEEEGGADRHYRQSTLRRQRGHAWKLHPDPQMHAHRFGGDVLHHHHVVAGAPAPRHSARLPTPQPSPSVRCATCRRAGGRSRRGGAVRA